MSKVLIILGLVLCGIGVALHLGAKPPTWLGRLPGDIMINRPNFKFYFPLTTCILLSFFITFILHLFKK